MLYTGFYIYVIVINIIAAIVTAADKYRAVHKKWRVRESVLLLLAFAGGGAGVYVTMLLVRHKTRRLKFMLGIPLIMLLQTAAVFLVYLYGKQS